MYLVGSRCVWRSPLPTAMRFSLWVAQVSGAPFTKNFEASSLVEAVSAAKLEGLHVLDTAIARTDVRPRGSRSRRFSVHLFTQELVALLDAGLTLMEGLQALTGKADVDERRILHALVNDLSTGSRFSAALEQSGEFPSIYVSLVRASEQTSDLSTSLQRYLIHSTQMDEARQKAISAAIYPALLIVVGAAAMVFLLLYVVPRFSGIYDGMRGELPWSAQLMAAKFFL
jgi:general secretion pathway protein F